MVGGRGSYLDRRGRCDKEGGSLFVALGPRDKVSQQRLGFSHLVDHSEHTLLQQSLQLAILPECFRCNDMEKSVKHAFFQSSVVRPLCKFLEGYMVCIMNVRFFLSWKPVPCAEMQYSRWLHRNIMCFSAYSVFREWWFGRHDRRNFTKASLLLLRAWLLITSTKSKSKSGLRERDSRGRSQPYFHSWYSRVQKNFEYCERTWCGTMASIHSVGVGVSERQSEDSFVCFVAKPTQRACVRDFLRDRKKTMKAISQSSEPWGVSNSQEKATVRERRLLKSAPEEKSWDLWTQKPGQPAREDE